MVYVHNGVLLSHKQEKILPFAVMWKELEGIMLSEQVRKRKTNTVRYHICVKSKKYSKLVSITKEKQIHRFREQASGYGEGDYRDEGEGGTNYCV